MKGEAKMVFKSKLKWIGLLGLVLSAFSLFIHFLLARYTEDGISDYQSSITIFSWRPSFENADLPRTVMCTRSPQRSHLSLSFSSVFLCFHCPCGWVVVRISIPSQRYDFFLYDFFMVFRCSV